MLKICKQVQAEQDLINIWIYSLQNWSEVQADKYLDQINQGIQLIAENPGIGVACEEVRPGYRKYLVNCHLIFYRVNKETLQIIRVLGQDMDCESHL